jgi:predicted naringenin-chalcone synthase
MKSKITIRALSTLLPEYKYDSEEQMEFYKKWISSQNESLQKKAIQIFKNATVKEKHTIISIEDLFKNKSFAESNNIYRKKAIELGTECLKNTLEMANLKPEELDYIIMTSCTGFMIPSFGAYISETLGLKKNVRHLPITELGCVAGVSALIFANDFLRAYPGKKVAIITLEFPSNTIQLTDFSIQNIIGTAIFSDGVGCAILETNGDGPEITATEMYQHPNTTELLGYNITETGLKMNISRELPDIIKENFETIVGLFLQKNGLSINNIDNFLVHPGGIKILDNIDDVISKYGKKTEISRSIMDLYGNMSSSTILFILEKFLKENVEKNQNSLVLSFGPGFSAHQLLLKSN